MGSQDENEGPDADAGRGQPMPDDSDDSRQAVCTGRLRQSLARMLSGVRESEGKIDPGLVSIATEVAELEALDQQRAVQEKLGILLTYHLAAARPAGTEQVSIVDLLEGDSLLRGVEYERAERELDNCHESPPAERSEVLQRLADFIASNDVDLAGAAKVAVQDEANLASFGYGLVVRAWERWPLHVEISLQRWAGFVGMSALASARGKKAAAQRTTKWKGAVARMWAAFVGQHPEFLEPDHPPIGAALRLLARRRSWGGIEVENVGSFRKENGRWVGEATIDGEPKERGALETALSRLRRNHQKSTDT